MDCVAAIFAQLAHNALDEFPLIFCSGEEYCCPALRYEQIDHLDIHLPWIRARRHTAPGMYHDQRTPAIYALPSKMASICSLASTGTCKTSARLSVVKPIAATRSSPRSTSCIMRSGCLWRVVRSEPGPSIEAAARSGMSAR